MDQTQFDIYIIQTARKPPTKVVFLYPEAGQEGERKVTDVRSIEIIDPELVRLNEA